MTTGRGLVIGLVAVFVKLVFFQAHAVMAANFDVDRTDDSATATGCTSAPNDCSIRGAIIAANANPGPDVINLPAGNYILTLTGTNEDAAATGDLDITDSSGALTMAGAEAATTVIDGNGTDRVFHI